MNENENKEINSQDSNDDFVIGKGFVVDESTNSSSQSNDKKSSNKGTNIIKNIIWIVSLIVVSLAVAYGIIFVGANLPDSLLFKIAVLPQYKQNVEAVCSSAIISAPQFLQR